MLFLAYSLHIRSFAQSIASGSRNNDRPATPPQSQDVNTRDLRAPHPNGSSNISTPPAIVPPRSASLPLASPGALSSSSSLPYRANEAELAYTRVPTSIANNSGASMPHGKSSQQNTFPPGLPIDANGVLSSHSQTPSTPHTPNAVASPHTPSFYSTSASAAHGTHPASLTPHASSNLSSTFLSPIPENLKSVNRTSNISLPDEAKRYFANMIESPGLTETVETSGSTQARTGQSADSGKGAHSGDETEFLDMDEEEGGVEETQQQQQPSPAMNRNDKSAHNDDFAMPPSHAPTQIHHPSHTQNVPSQPMLNSGPRQPAAPEAVMASQVRWQSQSDISMSSQSQSSLEYASLTPQLDSSFPESYLSPTRTTHGASSNLTFRALPLIAVDLKTTHVTVSHSSIRPNDRGKEVLSFEIEVDPGNGKEPWKVEKLYSDVLGLDHRLRAILGKGVSKKIATLPEGKLWRDHAPAKSDQRKVSKIIFQVFLER